MPASIAPQSDLSKYTATILFGLEEILAQELADLGA